jgi:hypothetical protein
MDSDVREYFLLDGSRKRVERTHVNPEEFAKDLAWKRLRHRAGICESEGEVTAKTRALILPRLD